LGNVKEEGVNIILTNFKKWLGLNILTLKMVFVENNIKRLTDIQLTVLL
jgi:hypothetical protein